MICDRCGAKVPNLNYTEVYNPCTEMRFVVYCCDSCQDGLSKVILGFVSGQLPTDKWTKQKLEECMIE